MQLVSIIIAVYNTESYLHKCIDSVINQTYKNLEIILVDDGSTDNSSTICDEYARKDTRIKCFHQENQGLALSRKLGITQSHGDFILTVDSDDWIEPTMVEKMLSEAIDNDFDVVWCDVMIGSARICVGKAYRRCRGRPRASPHARQGVRPKKHHRAHWPLWAIGLARSLPLHRRCHPHEIL